MGVNVKTNQMMTVNIGEHVLNIEHKTKLGNLNQLWEISNSYRIAKGLEPKSLDNWKRRPETMGFVVAVAKDLGIDFIDDSRGLENALESTHKGTVKFKVVPGVIETRRGRNAGTFAHLHILIDAAAYLDPEFKLYLYKSLSNGETSQG